MSRHDPTGDYEPLPLGQWPPPADDPDDEPDEGWAKHDPDQGADPVA